jgi:hypothetical protein
VYRLAKTIQDSVLGMEGLELDKKDNQFHTLWIQELRERLDTKDNK